MSAADLDAAVSAQDLGLLFERALRRYGLTHFAIGPAPRPGRDTSLTLTNWPAGWIERYALNGYAAEDVAVEEARRSSAPRSWGELKALHPGRAARILAAAAEFGWRDGFVVPVHGADGEVGLVATMGPCLRVSNAAERAGLVDLALRTYRRAEVLATHPPRVPALTPRERDALHCVAQGKDDRAIAAALGVTPTSAHAYVERAKKRLGAATRAQAVALAVSFRLIAAPGAILPPNGDRTRLGAGA